LEDLLTPDDSVDMRKATIIIWRNRHKPEVISELAEVLSEYSDQKTVFEGIEFYLPQLAHMIIHLEVDWPTAALEQFVLIVCQHSLHFALQLHFILVGAMEDYQVEGVDGRRTAHGNGRYYRRCAKLLQNVHRCVVYGAPRVRHLEDLYRSGKLSKTELEEMGIAERRFQAAQMLDPAEMTVGGKEPSVLEGHLSYKRHLRRSCCHSKGWKQRWFKIQDRVLYCYNNKEGGRLHRAIPLEAAVVTIIPNPRHEHYFEVSPAATGAMSVVYMLKADSEDEMQKWVKHLQDQSIAPTFHQKGEEHMLYPAEFGRYQFFKSQRDFINRLTDISEEMRFLDRAIRTKALKERLPDVKVPPAAYLPLCKSTAPWSRILSLLPEEARAFSTKARCPCLVLFEVERDSQLDVANYLHQRYGALDAQGDRPPSMRLSTSQGAREGEGEKDGSLVNGKEVPALLAASPAGTNTGSSGGSKGPPPSSSLISTATSSSATSTSSNLNTSHIKPAGLGGIDDISNPAPPSFTSVQSVSSLAPSSKQHGQEAPLCLGPLVDNPDEEAEEDSAAGAGMGEVLREGVPGSMHRRLSLAGIGMRNSMSTRSMNPSLWRVSRPNIAQELRKLPSEFRAALRKRSRTPSSYGVRGGGEGGGGTGATQGGVAGTSGGGGSKIEAAFGFNLTARSSMEGGGEGGRRESDWDDPNKIVPCYGEVWVQKRNRLREKTTFTRAVENGSWDLQAVIVKSNDDVRQEVFVMELISFYEEVFKQAGLAIWLRSYMIISTGNNTGLIAFLTDAISFDGLKKSNDYPGTLRGHFEKIYGGSESAEFKAAQQNFAQSLAGYSLLSYLLCFKDRHNGNIMIDKKGHVIHIDFGFVLGIMPGGKFSFERAPFKLTAEMVEILDGPNSALFKYVKGGREEESEGRREEWRWCALFIFTLPHRTGPLISTLFSSRLPSFIPSPGTTKN